ncbi:MAG: RecB-family nuclease [Pyrobaculum sp.]
MDLTVAVYSINSVPKMLEMAKIAYGFGVKRFVLIRVFGAAAQQIGDLFKLSFKMGGEVLVFNDVQDAVEVLRPDVVYALTRPDNKDARPIEKAEGKVLLLVHGADLSFSQKELPQGAVLVYAVPRDIGSTGQLAVALYKLLFSS